VRRSFWQASAKQGWKWLGGVTDSIGRILLILALFGVPTAGAALLDLGWIAAIIGFGFLAIIALAEGAYRTWSDFAADLGQRAMEDQDAAKFSAECFEWIATVERFLEVRDTLAPPLGKPPTPAERAKLERHEQETLALFIEQYRDDGAVLFDRLVNGGYSNDNAQERVHAPKSRFAINDTIFSIHLAAERIHVKR
jgi:hypothetical protein